MHLYLKMQLVFENRCMHLYSNTKNILRQKRALIFEHEMTFQHKEINLSTHLFCNDNVVRITLLIHHISIEMCIISLFQENNLRKYLQLLYNYRSSYQVQNKPSSIVFCRVHTSV